MSCHSLRAKLVLAFSLVAVALVALTLFAVAELRELEQRIRVERSTTALFDQVREVRNRENRLFLFRKASHFAELREEIGRTLELIDASQARLTPLAGAARIGELRESLQDYARQLERYQRNARQRDATGITAEERIRDQRRHFIEIAERLADAAQADVQAGLEQHRRRIGSGIGGLVVLMMLVAWFLIRRIVRPLKSIESQMEEVAAGAIGRVDFASGDQELTALGKAFNHVMNELEERQRMALQSEKLAALGTMLSGVAHELNNPLSNISTTVQIIGEEIDQISRPELARRLDRIDQQTERARGIVRGLLEYARSNPQDAAPLAVRASIEQAVEAINHGRPSPRRILTEVDAGLQLVGSAERLQRVLINLLANAIDATPDADPIVVMAHPAAGDGPHRVEIWVQDCGSGIDPDQAAHIFDPFYTTKPAGRGTGLGLFIAHEIVKQHGGSIRVISPPGCGTSIGLILPNGART